MKRFPIALLLLLFSFGCKKEARVPGANINDELVALSFISPQSSNIEVELLIAFTPFQGGKKIDANSLKDATVEISHNNLTKHLYWSGISSFQRERNIFMISASEMPILAGEKYFLKAVLPNGIEATAETVVPLEPLDITTSYTKYSLDARDDGFLITGDVKLYPSQKDFYRIGVYRDDLPSDVMAEDYFNAANNPSEYLPFRFDVKGGLKYSNYSGVQVSLIHKDYYYYAMSVKNNERINGNPFTEPSSLYTNVKGALGVFTSFNSKRIEVYYY